MNITGLEFNGARDNQVNQPDDRRFGRKILEMINIIIVTEITFSVPADIFNNAVHGTYFTAKNCTDHL